jgi:hypothetical protein
MAEHQLPKLTVRVRFPSSAPHVTRAPHDVFHNARYGRTSICSAETGSYRSRAALRPAARRVSSLRYRPRR